MGSRKRRDGGKGGAQLATTNNQIRIFRADPELPKILVVPQLPNQVVAQLLKKGLVDISPSFLAHRQGGSEENRLRFRLDMSLIKADIIY